MAKLRIRKGDTVQVMTGRDRGKKGKVIKVDTERERVLVEGVNQVKKHTKVGQGTRGAKTGGIITTEAPIHVSNVQIVDPETSRPSRIGYRREPVTKNRPDGTSYEATRSVRVSKRSGKDL